VGKTGLWAELKGTAPFSGDENVVALRGDMDALPIGEHGDLPFKSTVPGVMHACGHDTHTTSLLGAALILEHFRDKIPGRVWFFFQPGEEVLAGALTFINDPAIDFSKIKAMCGVHQWPDLDVGKVSLFAGVTMAASDLLSFHIKGSGGHGSAPETTRDPIVATAELIGQLQTVVSREIGALDAAVITIGSIHGGERGNIIPEEVTMEGSLRTLDKDVRQKVIEAIRRICKGIALSLRVDVDFELGNAALPVYNDPKLIAMSDKALRRVLGDDAVVYGDKPRMVSEDFCYFANKVPGVFLGHGSRTPGKAPAQVHSCDFYSDPATITFGTLTLCAFALEYFGVVP
jgi:amidohydrolase